MKKIIITSSFIAALAIAGNALASADEDLHAMCMKDSANSAQDCTCTIDLVKTRMGDHDYKMLHALATSTSDEERAAKVAAAGGTMEEAQGIGEKFQALAGDIESQCHVKVQTGNEDSAG